MFSSENCSTNTRSTNFFAWYSLTLYEWAVQLSFSGINFRNYVGKPWISHMIDSQKVFIPELMCHYSQLWFNYWEIWHLMGIVLLAGTQNFHRTLDPKDRIKLKKPSQTAFQWVKMRVFKFLKGTRSSVRSEIRVTFGNTVKNQNYPFSGN